MALEIRIDKSDARATKVFLSGGLTLGPQLRQFNRQMEGLFSGGAPRAIFLDFANVRMIDSAGLGELVILYTSAGQHNCRVCLLQAPSSVVRLLEVTRLDGILRNFTDAESAGEWLERGNAH